MRKTDSTLVLGYSPKVKKACFPTSIFLYSLEQHKERGLLDQMKLLHYNWTARNRKKKKKKKRDLVTCVQESKAKTVLNFRMALGENTIFFCYGLVCNTEFFVFLKTGHH